MVSPALPCPALPCPALPCHLAGKSTASDGKGVLAVALAEQDEEEQGDVQANAEPDLQQTGGRLKPVVAGLIEGIMQLVVDPLALSQVTVFLLSVALTLCTLQGQSSSSFCFTCLYGRKQMTLKEMILQMDLLARPQVISFCLWSQG